MHCWVYLEFQFFGMGCLRQKPVLLKSYQKLFPSVSSEPLKVPWCFICQTKSPHVEIKWLKGYCIPSTFTENIPDQSCISNRWTPCIKTGLSSMEWKVKRETRMWPNIIYFNAKKYIDFQICHWWWKFEMFPSYDFSAINCMWFMVYLLQEHIKLVTKCFGEVVASATCSRSMCAGFPRHFVIVKKYLCIRLVYASF